MKVTYANTTTNSHNFGQLTKDFSYGKDRVNRPIELKYKYTRMKTIKQNTKYTRP